jgi:hypothetical protein
MVIFHSYVNVYQRVTDPWEPIGWLMKIEGFLNRTPEKTGLFDDRWI